MSRRIALIIGNNEYLDKKFTGLFKSGNDALALASVLHSSDRGAFDEIVVLVNQSVDMARRAIVHLFTQKKREDLLLFYFSGHGVLDDRGGLFFAFKDTESDLLSATAISASFITKEMDESRSQRQLVILDCCFSGAFVRGKKNAPGITVGTKQAFEGSGYGRVVLTATDATQYAWENDEIIGKAENSLFTYYLLQSLKKGIPNTKRKEWIDIDELYEYTYEQILDSVRGKQTPCKWSYKQQGDVLIAKNVFKPSLRSDTDTLMTSETNSVIQKDKQKTILGVSSKRLTCCMWDKSRDQIYIAGFDKRLYRHDLSKDITENLSASNAIIRVVYFAQNWPFIIIGNDDGRLIAIDFDKQNLYEIGFVNDPIYAITKGRGDSYILVAQRSGEISEWEIMFNNDQTILSGQMLRIIHKHEGAAFSVKYHELTDECVSVGADGVLKLTKLDTGHHSSKILSKSTLFSLALDNQRSLYAVGDSQGEIWLWNKEKDRHRNLKGHLDNVRCINFSPSFQWLITGSKDCTVRLWHVDSGRVWIVYKTQDYVYEAIFSDDGSHIAIVDGTGTLTLLHLNENIDKISPNKHIDAIIQKLRR